MATPIKWRPRDRKKLAQSVRNFNAKRTRLIKQIPELAEVLPPKLTVEGIRKEITTRADFNRINNSLARFMRKDATKIIVTDAGHRVTKWERDEMMYANRIRNAKRLAQQRQANVSTEKGTMGTIEQNNLNPRTFNWRNMNKSSWEKFREQLDREIWDKYSDEKKQIYVDNYITSLDTMYGNVGQEQIKMILDRLSVDDIGTALFDDPILNIQYQYTNEGEMQYQQNIFYHWLMFLQDRYPNIYEEILPDLEDIMI